MERKKLFFIISLIALAGLLFLVTLISTTTKNNGITELPEGTSIDIINEAYLHETSGEHTIAEYVVSDKAFSGIKTDFKLFAKDTYEQYQEEDTVVIFNVSNTKIEDEVLVAYGKFAQEENEVESRIRLLNNERIEISIRDVDSGKTMDENLPSNSQLNQYIATLPVSKENYTAEYKRFSEIILVSFNSRNSSLRDSYKKDVWQKINDGSLDEDMFVFSFPNMSLVP